MDESQPGLQQQQQQQQQQCQRRLEIFNQLISIPVYLEQHCMLTLLLFHGVYARVLFGDHIYN